jgi:glycerol-3-phosphate dehydrogenase
LNKKYDVIIIGAGISGCAVAWKLARYNLDILLLEKEADVATGTTKANTAIMHAGYNADPNKLKGRLNVKGNEEIREVSKKLNMEIVDRDWLFEHEPNISRDAVKALWAPTAGVITPWEAALAMAQNAVANGAEVKLETAVEDVLTEDGQVVGVKTNRGNFAADYVVNAAGLYADEIAEMVGIEKIKILQ